MPGVNTEFRDRDRLRRVGCAGDTVFLVSESPTKGSSLKALAARVLPWAVAGFILWFLFQRIPLDDALAAAGKADLRLLVPAALSSVVVWFFLDSAGLAYIFSRFNAPLSFREARSVRALTYLLAVLNWNLGTGGIVLHMRHAKGTPVAQATSTILFYNSIDALILVSLVVGASFVLPEELGLASLQLGGLVFLAALSAMLAVFISRWEPPWAWLRRFMGLGVFHAHRQATWRDVFVVLGIRTLYFGVFVAFFAIALVAFGAAVPLSHVAATVPPILFVGTLPITPAGLGTQQAAVVYFYRAFAPEAELLALSFLFSIVFVILRAPLALFYLNDLGTLRAEIAAGADESSAP